MCAEPPVALLRRTAAGGDHSDERHRSVSAGPRRRASPACAWTTTGSAQQSSNSHVGFTLQVVQSVPGVFMRNFLTLAVACSLASGCATTANEDSAELVGSEWRVTQIGGVAVAPNSGAAISFGADGRFHGNAGCNRMFGTYRTDGATLSLSNAGLTRMLCAPAEMEQEREFVELLGQVNSYRIDPAGSLVLTTRTGAEIVASR